MEGHHTTAGASAEVLDRPVAECAADSERQFVRRRQSRASEALHGSWALPNRDSLPPTVGSAPGPLRRPWSDRRGAGSANASREISPIHILVSPIWPCHIEIPVR